MFAAPVRTLLSVLNSGIAVHNFLFLVCAYHSRTNRPDRSSLLILMLGHLNPTTRWAHFLAMTPSFMQRPARAGCRTAGRKTGILCPDAQPLKAIAISPVGIQSRSKETGAFDSFTFPRRLEDEATAQEPRLQHTDHRAAGLEPAAEGEGPLVAAQQRSARDRNLPFEATLRQ